MATHIKLVGLFVSFFMAFSMGQTPPTGNQNYMGDSAHTVSTSLIDVTIDEETFTLEVRV